VKESDKYLLVGLGNPGREYENTRHNVGFEVLDFFAKHHGFVFRASTRFFSTYAQGKIQDKQVILLKPMTFMNLSGRAIKSCMDYFAISHERLVVVCDDITVALGQMRMRMKGSSGGHNGLKDVQRSLATEEYPRLRIGIGKPPLEQNLSDYVLGRFTEEQHRIIEGLIPLAIQVLDKWLVKGIEASMQLVQGTKATEIDE
jgi:peptidyl-tRNA hydrolase, PTH1 family